MILATVCCESFYHRCLLVDVADDTVDNVVYAVGHAELQRRNIHQLWSLDEIHLSHNNLL